MEKRATRRMRMMKKTREKTMERARPRSIEAGEEAEDSNVAEGKEGWGWGIHTFWGKKC